MKQLLIAITETPVEQTARLDKQEQLELFGLAATIQQDIVGMTIEYLNMEAKANKEQPKEEESHGE
jgi:hypothetical protein